MQCYKHPNVETYLRCGKCDRPICTKCTRIGPAGARCPDCAALRSSPLYRVEPSRMVIGVCAGVASSAVAGYLLLLVAGFGWLVYFWGGFLVGWGIGEVMLRVLERKRGPKAEAATGLSSAVGLAAAFFIWAAAHGLPLSPEVIAAHVFYWVAAGIAVFTALGRIKYI